MNNQNENQQFDILDIIALLSFIIGIENLQENRQQSEVQEEIIQSIENHLIEQDKQYNKIIELLERKI